MDFTWLKQWLRCHRLQTRKRQHFKYVKYNIIIFKISDDICTYHDVNDALILQDMAWRSIYSAASCIFSSYLPFSSDWSPPSPWQVPTSSRCCAGDNSEHISPTASTHKLHRLTAGESWSEVIWTLKLKYKLNRPPPPFDGVFAAASR